MNSSVQRFLDDLKRVLPDIEEEISEGILFYTIENVRTGVEVQELQQWPDAPPHWIHLPASHPVSESFNPNYDPPIKDGFCKYSRNPSWSGIRNVSDNPGKFWIRILRGYIHSWPP